MAKIINLNQARKRRLGADKQRRADENAARHGRSQAERRVAETQAASERRRLDGCRLAPEADFRPATPEAE